MRTSTSPNGVLIVVALVAIGCRKTEYVDNNGAAIDEVETEVDTPEPMERTPLLPAGEVAGTTIVPTLDSPLENSGNAIWCATFQVAWNYACNDVGGGPLEVAGAEQVAKRLNDSPVTEATLPPGSYYAVAGATDEGVVEEIHQQMAKRFPDVEPPAFQGAQGLVAYAYLRAAAKFTTPFEKRTYPIEFTNAAGETVDVEGFCLYSGHDEEITHDQLSQVKVLFRESTDNPKSRRLTTFALDLTADQEETQVIVAVLPHADNLQAVLDNLEERTKAYKGKIRVSGADRLGIPNVLFHLKESFQQLTGPDKLIKNSEKLAGLFVDQAWQMIRFQLDESGAIVESEAALATAAEAAYEEQNVDYIADRPFLVVMKRRGEKYPYFVGWFGNAELLEVRGK
ncbi:hypothetical protein NG895_16335 [Aeoliella sp. ICT_H6.2]|uniref:Serpin domain-containing protein n=1 Tax=Aeoliella straminimaris TaxID=2954799 RepID=A0A9X2FAV6_9BACT|nr:serpin family protein [Aeoliella straminimaris]MCO6045480.1 hypothetical protein [Aeoliella straminimaris]